MERPSWCLDLEVDFATLARAGGKSIQFGEQHAQIPETNSVGGRPRYGRSTPHNVRRVIAICHRAWRIHMQARSYLR